MIDVHCHFLPAPYMEAVRDRLAPGRGQARARGWSADADLERMDGAGVALSIGSIPIPGVWFRDVALARRLSRVWNEAAADIVRDRPKRFGFFAAVAPPDIDGALAEIAHAFETLRADGVALMSNYDGRWLGDEAFDPVMAELDRRRAVVFVHPAAVPQEHGPAGLKSHVLEGPFDTTRTVASLLARNVFERRPGIRFVFAHGGGALPYLAGRLATLAGDGEPFSKARVEALSSRAWFDTALSMNGPAMAALTAFCAPANIVFGTDSPILPTRTEIERWRATALAPELRRRIEHDNAAALLGRSMDEGGHA